MTFICRYLSHEPAKDLTAAELRNATAAGLAVVVVWETTANRMLAGRDSGAADARAADTRVRALGMTGAVIYFACDWDATETQQAPINAYLDGAASVIGHARTGIYGGYWPVRRALDAGKAAWAWQTYAWSGGNWDRRAQLRQVQNNVRVAGVSADWDESTAGDYGQWPRPGAPRPPAPPKPPPAKAPPFPYPAGHYLGKQSPDPHCHSGYNPADRPRIQTWQTQMAARGWTITADGLFGDQSDRVCRAFQAEKGLAVDGRTGNQTWKAAWATPVTIPNR